MRLTAGCSIAVIISIHHGQQTHSPYYCAVSDGPLQRFGGTYCLQLQDLKDGDRMLLALPWLRLLSTEARVRPKIMGFVLE